MPTPASASRPQRRTKIVATLGPASDGPEMIEALIKTGVNVVRINASHGDHPTHARTIARVRTTAQRLGKPVAILLDLQGPKIRIGRFEGPGREVAAGATFDIAVGRTPVGDELPADYLYLDRDCAPGQPLLINDGNLQAEVVHVEPGLVRARALHAGLIEQRKGINLPQSQVSAPAITEKDRADALFAVQQKVDLIAMSFVRRGEDVVELRQLLAAAGADTPIVAKIEKPQALDNLKDIIEAAWGIMVARGDLGVELSAADVPMAQKRIIREANRACRPVITATQMLDSMTRNPRPTRAEASDVANAVLDGSDAVMLSQETANGLYPVETVATMVGIIRATEAQHEISPAARRLSSQEVDIPEAVATAGSEIARQVGAKAIVVYTESGRMARLVSQRRPEVPIIAFARDVHVHNRLCLVCGVEPLMSPPCVSVEERLVGLDRELIRAGRARRGDRVVLMVGGVNAPSGSTNLMVVHTLGCLEAAAR